MKKITKLTGFMAVLCLTVKIYSQELISPSVEYQKDIDSLTLSSGKKTLFNSKMLNILFANKVGTAFTGSNDLSLQKYYASLDASDKSISLGFNFDSRRGDETKKLTWVHNASLKFKSADNFAVIYDNDGTFQKSNIGGTYKISLIGNGIINFNNKNSRKLREQAVLNNREVLKKKFNGKVKKYNTKQLNGEKNAFNNAKKFDSILGSFDGVLKAKQDALYVELAKEEVEFIEKNQMYNFLWDHWYSFYVYVPFGNQTYKTTPAVETSLVKNEFYSINATLSANYMWFKSNGTSFFVKGFLNFKNNNNILVNDLSSKKFQTISQGADNKQVITDSADGYITVYDAFLTTSITIEPAWFFLSFKSGSIGFSPSIEKNFGEYDKINWKLGIPISLKNKDGKPSVNFELQWKEQYTMSSSVHLVGLSANFLFGDLIN